MPYSFRRTGAAARGALAVAMWIGLAGPVAAQGFLDAHTHLNDPVAWSEIAPRGGVEGAVVMRGRSASHESLLEAAERWPGTMYPFVSVSPEHREYRGYWERDDPAVAVVVDSLLSRGGFYGIGELSVAHFPGAGFPEADFDPAGRASSAVFEVARRHGVPVTLHVEVTRLREFEDLLQRFPDVTVIWAHGGYTPLVVAQRLIETHSNLIYELSARTWARHPRSPDYTILHDGTSVWPRWVDLIERYPDRFIVGSDAALRSIEGDAAKFAGVLSFLDQLEPEARRRVARENLRRILGLL